MYIERLHAGTFLWFISLVLIHSGASEQEAGEFVRYHCSLRFSKLLNFLLLIVLCLRISEIKVGDCQLSELI